MPAMSPALGRIARPWHLVTALVSLVSLVVQIILTIRGINVLVDDTTGRPAAETPIRVLRFFSYFTVQSNILVIIACLGLAARPDRDGRWWRVLRLAGMVGITVTIVVYFIALRPILDLKGISAATDAGFHIVAPLMAIVGWLVFGPRPRFDASVLLWSLVWPGLYFVYSLIHGALTGWYPYPFVDVTKIGYPATLRNLALVVVLLLLVGLAYVWADRRLGPTGAAPARSADRHAVR